MWFCLAENSHEMSIDSKRNSSFIYSEWKYKNQVVLIRALRIKIWKCKNSFEMSHYENMPIQIMLKILPPKKEILQI